VDGATFSAVVALVFGLLSWLQLPALCAFIFDSTRAGADNYRYSLILGAILAVIGCFSGLHAFRRGTRGVLLVAGAVINLSFIAAASLAPGMFDGACHAFYIDVSKD
jgi:hypothetical protein